MTAFTTAQHTTAHHSAARMASRPMPSHKTLAAVAAARIAANELPKGKPFTVPFSKLFLSPNNVRSAKEPSAEGIARLAAMIEAEGLLADLHVSAETKDGQPTGRFAVEAGGRRWRALGLLVKQGKLSPDAPINCKGVEPQNATAVSLSENLGQEAMHPIDEFHAYAAMEKEGKTAEAIAQRFGVTVLHVQRRMRLAAVAPSLLALYRDEKATLDHMMALATVDDPKRQVAVWNSLPDYNRNPATIRRRLTEEEVHCADPRVKLITLERYIASGGTTRLDLFGTPGDEFLTDAGLVDLIVAEVLEEHAAKARAEGWGFVEVLPEFGHDERARFVQAPKVYKPEPPEVSQQREAIEAEPGGTNCRCASSHR